MGQLTSITPVVNAEREAQDSPFVTLFFYSVFRWVKWDQLDVAQLIHTEVLALYQVSNCQSSVLSTARPPTNEKAQRPLPSSLSASHVVPLNGFPSDSVDDVKYGVLLFLFLLTG